MKIESRYAYREHHTFAEVLARRVALIHDGVVTGIPKDLKRRVRYYRSTSDYLRNLSRVAKVKGTRETRRRYLLLARADATIARMVERGAL